MITKVEPFILSLVSTETNLRVPGIFIALAEAIGIKCKHL